MRAHQLQPTATTYTALVSAHCKSDNLEAALEVSLLTLQRTRRRQIQCVPNACVAITVLFRAIIQSAWYDLMTVYRFFQPVLLGVFQLSSGRQHALSMTCSCPSQEDKQWQHHLQQQAQKVF